MLAVEIKQPFDAYNRVSNRMRHLIKVLEVDIDQIVSDWADEETQRLAGKPYPPQPLNSRYIRTGTLAGSWRDERGHRKGAVNIVNDAADATKGGRIYPNFVIGEQTAVMAGIGWWKMDDELPEMTDRFKRAIEDAVNEAMAANPI